MVQFIKFIDFNGTEVTLNLNHVVEITSEKRGETSLLVDIIGEYEKADGERIAPTHTIGACYEYICYQINSRSNDSERFINVDGKYEVPDNNDYIYAEKYIEFHGGPDNTNIELRYVLDLEHDGKANYMIIRLTRGMGRQVSGVSIDDCTIFGDLIKALKRSGEHKGITQHEGKWMLITLNGRYESIESYLNR